MIFARTDKNTPTEPKETRTMTTTPTTETPAPPPMYPRPDWAPEGDPFHVEPEDRQSYVAAQVDLGKALAAAAEGKAGRLTWLPLQEAERLRDEGRLVVLFSEPVSEDGRLIQVRVKVEEAEALHMARLAAVKQAQQRPAPPPPRVDVCCVCGVTSSQGTTIARRTGAPYLLGLRDPLCEACTQVAVVVLAEQEVSPGRTRRQAVAEAAGRGPAA